jgi:hypothetical protein
MRRLLIVLQIACSSVGSPAASFQNLDFESPVLPLTAQDSYGRVPIANALPGWTAFAGANPETLVLYNTIFLDSTGVGLVGPLTGDPGPFPTQSRIEGNYTVFLEAGFELFNSSRRSDAIISQFGVVPDDTRSLQFKVFALGAFTVCLGGENLSLIPLSTSTDFTLYAGDASRFSGQTAELRFTAISSPERQPNVVWLDSISFSPVPIPEPGIWALVGMGLLFLGCQLCRRR